MTDLRTATDLFRTLGDPTRVRLLALLRREPLSVAELTAVTRLAQSRVSTHLARLRDAGLVRARREGALSYYALDDGGGDPAARAILERVGRNDPLLDQDARRARELVARRGNGAAGDAHPLERHYTPGRSWEALLRGLLGLLDLGDVLDVACGDAAVAELVAPRARSVTCLDLDEAALDAARRRLRRVRNLAFRAGDMHDLPFRPSSFDSVLLLNCLTCSERPARALAEAARVLRPGGRVVATTLAPHRHEAESARHGHRRLGFPPPSLASLARRAGLEVTLCAPTSRERRPPHFEIVTLHARKP